jgi:hypothetical protein
MKTQTCRILPVALALIALLVDLSALQPAKAATWVITGPMTAARCSQTARQILLDPAFRFGFTLLASNGALRASSKWTGLGTLTEISPDQFQFTDSQETFTPSGTSGLHPLPPRNHDYPRHSVVNPDLRTLIQVQRQARS